jgi:hypothetical protein
MAVDLNQKTVLHLRKLGMHAQKVEYYNAHSKRRKDLFGVFDVVAVGLVDGVPELWLIQATSMSNRSKRTKKTLASEAAWVCSKVPGVRVMIFAWKKVKGNWKLSFRELEEHEYVTEEGEPRDQPPREGRRTTSWQGSGSA